MDEKIKLSGVPETMLQTVYARAKESRGRGARKAAAGLTLQRGAQPDRGHGSVRAGL